MNLGALMGPLAGGVCSERLGKKTTLLLAGVPLIISHVLCAIALNVHFFLVARFLIGITVGIVFGVLPSYVGDIAEDKNRGSLGSILGVSNCCGVLFMYVLGPFVSVRIFSLVNLIPPVAFYAVFGFFVPQSPYDLLKRGYVEEAEASLKKVRGANDVEKELAYIREVTDRDSNAPGVTFFDLFKTKSLTRGLLISNCLMVFQQLSGICAVIGYNQTIFEMTGSSIPSEYSAILVGAVQLVSNLASAQLVEKAGRRMLLLISCLFSMISLVLLGGYFFMMSQGLDVEQISWLPIASLITFMVAFNLGLANIPWVVLSELFPNNVKAISATVTTFFSFGLSFLVTVTFPFLSEGLGMPGTFWIFSTVLLCGFVFCITVVPETKGKSCQEIQGILEGVKK